MAERLARERQRRPQAAEGRTAQRDRSAIELREVADDRQAEPRSSGLLIAAVTSHPVLGDLPIEAVFSDYKDSSGVKFPTRI